MNKITRECLDLYLEGNKPDAIAKIINPKYGTELTASLVRDRIRCYSEYKEMNGKVRGAVEISEPPVIDLPSKEQLIGETKDKIMGKHKQKMLDDLIKERATQEIIIEKCIEAIESLPKLEITPISFQIKQHYSEQEAVLQISDIQAGTFISKEATGGLNGYNKDILKYQFEKLRESMISIITKQKQVVPIKKLNIHMLGDMVEGMDIFIGQAQHVDQDLYEQFFGLAELLVKFIIEMQFLFEEIEISAIGGNHGRVGRKGENPHYVNWDVFLYKYMEARLQNYDRIKWNIPLSWWYLDEIQGHHFLLLHGDDIKGWNGIPYYGIDRADAKWTQLLGSKGLTYEYMELGHFHSASELARVKGEKIVNGCWPGGSIFALKSLVTSGRPRQNLFFVHPEHGKIASYPIWLDFD